jgi:hypothetical protein
LRRALFRHIPVDTVARDAMNHRTIAILVHDLISPTSGNLPNPQEKGQSREHAE